MPVWFEKWGVLKDDDEIVSIFRENADSFHDFVTFVEEKKEYLPYRIYYTGSEYNSGKRDYAKYIYDINVTPVEVVIDGHEAKIISKDTTLAPEERAFMDFLADEKISDCFGENIFIEASEQEEKTSVKPIISMGVFFNNFKSIELRYQTDYEQKSDINNDKDSKKVIKLDGGWYFLIEDVSGRACWIY